MIYADHAATTALSPKAREAMEPFLTAAYGNPSTLYSLAREPHKALTHSREIIASAIHADPSEVFFTSGGTESDNWAIKGTVFQHAPGKRIITSSIEHHAVLNTCAALGRMGYSISTLPVSTEGIVSESMLKAALTPDTALVSIMLANNEIGTIEPVQTFAEIARRRNALFHTDAVQAIGHIPVDVGKLQVDMLSASAHKFNGPKGVGFLYIRKGVNLLPLLDGGGQERGMRAGTENVAGIVGMATALQEHIDHGSHGRNNTTPRQGAVYRRTMKRCCLSLTRLRGYARDVPVTEPVIVSAPGRQRRDRARTLPVGTTAAPCPAVR